MKKLQTIEPKTAKSLLDKDEALLIDVREQGEYNAEHIPSATLHPLSTLDPIAIKQEAHGKKIIFHCLSGKRAGKACEKFIGEMDIEAMCLEGNIKGWKEAGFKTESNTNIISLDRQVFIIAGALILTGALLSAFDSSGWIWLSGIVGAGLLFAGLSGSCMMKKLLMMLPFNKGGN